MMPNLSRNVKQPKMSKKDEDDHDESKKSKKGKAVKAGGTVGTGRSLEYEESADPKLDIDEARVKGKRSKRPKIDAASQEQGWTKKSTQWGIDALTAAVG